MLSGRVALEFTALADALVGLDVRTCRYFLQKYLDRLRAILTLEGERSGWLIDHDFLKRVTMVRNDGE